MIDTRRVAALGTLRDGAPFVLLVPFVVVLDATAHPGHPRRSAGRLMVAESDGGAGDPQRLARVCIEGMAASGATGPRLRLDEARYLARFPDAVFNFTLADFSLFRIVPSPARYVANSGGYSI